MRHAGRVLACGLILAPCLLRADAPEAARKLVEEGRTAEAYRQLQAWIERVPDDPPALVLLGALEFDGARSQEYYRRAQQADPDGASASAALMGIANFYFANGFYNTAHRLAQQVVDAFPSSVEAPWAVLLIGRSLLATGQPGEAIAQLRPLLASPHADVHIAAMGVWAEACLAARRPRDVIRALADPGWEAFPYELSLLASAYRATGQATKAREIQVRATRARREWTNQPLGPTSLSAPASSVPEEPPRPVSPPQPAASAQAQTVPQPSAPEQQPTAPSARPSATAGAGTASVDEFRGGPKGYSLQVGAFGNEENALRVQRRLREAGYEVVIRRTASLHRVWVGNYPTSDAARAALPAVKQASGLQPAIVKNR